MNTPFQIRGSALKWALMPFSVALVWTVEGSAPSRASATVSSASGAPGESTKEGRQIFEASCAACHGLDGRGAERGPDIATRQQVVQLSDEATMELLKAGRPAAGMPPFAYLGEAKLKALLGHLRSLQGKSENEALAGDPAKGKALYYGKARCAECHTMQGSGGFLGRDLSSYGAGIPPAEIREKILAAGDTSGKGNKTAVVTMRDASKYKGVIRNEDNFSIQLQSFDGAFHFLSRADIGQLEFQAEPIMPADYDKSLSSAELDDLINYLVTTAKATGATKQHKWEEEE